MTGPSIAERSKPGRGARARVPVVYLDSSALVKLLIDEPESDDLERHLVGDDRVWSSALARVEVTRAVAVAADLNRAGAEVEARLRAWKLVAVTEAILGDAARLASRRLRSHDAIHLASALLVQADEFVTYDERLAEAARDHGMTVIQPGAMPGSGRRIHDRGG